MIDSIEQEIRTLRSIFWSGRDPEGRAFVPLADAYRRAGDFRQAVELLTEGLNRHPSFTSAHVVAAQLYHEKGLTAEAELAFRRVLELDPENVVALELLADSLHDRGEADAATELRGRHRELEGLAPTATAAEAPDPSGAWASDVGGQVEPEPEPVVDLADLAPDEPEPVVELADLAPDEPEPVVELADLAPDEPEPVVELADLAPDEPEPVVDLADLAPDEPEPVVELADLAPDDADFPAGEIDAAPMLTRTMAELFASQGLVDRALEVFRQLLDAAPGDAGLRRRIAELSARSDGSETVAPEAEPLGAPSEGVATPDARHDEDDLSGHAWDPGAQADHHEVDTPFAWTRQEPEEASPPGPAISTYFSRMLGWESGSSSAPDAAEDAATSDGPTHRPDREDQ